MRTHDDPRFFWFALRSVPNIGAVRFNTLVRKFGTPEAVLNASVAELQQLPDFGEKVALAIKTEVDFEVAAKQLERLVTSGAKMITLQDDTYPKLLRKIYDPPPFLLVQGEFLSRDERAVAIVGSRVCTVYGQQVAEKMAAGLAEAQITVVSGFARGIDSAAHRAAIKVGGRTIAVLGCGLDIIYPPENEPLFNEIASSGAVVSEYPFGSKPEKFNFPHRNRVIAGLSLGVVVVEAGRSSGALLTAEHALEQNREVFAVPGNISSSASAGTNELLRQGATPATSVPDVLLAIGFDPLRRMEAGTVEVALPEGEKEVYTILDNEPKQIDTIAITLKRPVAEVLAQLFNLEMAGLVRQLPGKLFLRQM